MKIWTITNQKGGAGKTVLATNFAVEAVNNGLKSLLIDLDPQQSATKWWENRTEEEPLLIKSPYSELSTNLKMAKEQKFDLVIIDTAGRESLKNTISFEESTFCIIPCQPSLDDCRSAMPTVEAIKKYSKFFSFVITRCPVNGDDFTEAKTSLSAIGSVCPFYTAERKCYKRAYAENYSVREYDFKDKATSEIAKIFKWLRDKEKRLTKNIF